MITRARIERVIDATPTALRRLGAFTPCVAVLDVNPHAGEDGMFGREELTTISPAIQAARKRGIAVEGSLGAGTMFGKPGFDAFIVMVHDQGHIVVQDENSEKRRGARNASYRYRQDRCDRNARDQRSRRAHGQGAGR